MDMFTDVDIFKEIVEASTRGISVYILLDEFNFNHFLNMTEKQGCQVQRLRVRIPCFFFSIFCVPFLSQLNLSHVKLYFSKSKIYIFKSSISVPLYFSECD